MAGLAPSQFRGFVRLTIVTVIVGLVCGTGIIAVADEGDQSAAVSRVEDLVAAARLDYADGRYDDALDKLRRAYELYPSAIILMNRGRIHEARKDCLRARAAYEEALELSSDDAIQGAAKAALQDLSDCPEATAVAVAEPAESFDWGYAAIIGGSAVIVAGIGFDLYYGSVYQDLEAEGSAGRDQRRFDALQDDYATGRTLVSVMYLAGALVTGTGTALLWLGGEDNRSGAMLLEPGPVGSIGLGAKMGF